ncbi:pyrethroid hydrolase Ces2e-like isoform X2 [Syngnathoides biaculeatus]|uniref:pyrethroid hydrolase Ces2e-like isoform X2 n=1 Tax=Syngnathoides biaculeatus TaxID=300417 RepID=UPI002ADE7B52|nr:pyrethroid hydrolase Ces2e-like isoform X2 [Syngnathoides biaculeatus]
MSNLYEVTTKTRQRKTSRLCACLLLSIPRDVSSRILPFALLLNAKGGMIDPVVSLANGRIRGKIVSVKETEIKVKQFLGIPFARPPLRHLRLAAPRNAEPWEGERDGTQQPAMCIQDADLIVNVSRMMSVEYTPTEVSEDCLYLNVYTRAEAKRGDKLPVMVWLHGGGLVMGAASHYDGAPLSAYENLVVVIVQYRLGILGFLGTGDEYLRGNWGFLDQLAALRWVQENIEAFGGDPQAVTIAGESAGGISASILTLSPQAQGLFQRAIFQSGVATVGTYTSKHSSALVKIVANLTGCDDSSSQELAQCLRGKSKDELVAATKKMKIYLGGVVDGVFLTDTADELLKRKEVMPVPVLMGITNHEFGWILPQSFALPGWANGMTRESVLTMVNMFNPEGTSLANSLIVDEYLKTANTQVAIRDAFTELMGDLLMTLPVVKVADYHTGINPKDFAVNKKKATLIDFGLLQARRTIALFWKKVDVPSIKVWMLEMASCVALERLTFIMRGRAQEFEDIWRPLEEFLKKMSIICDLCAFFF